ncbi:hypothetical protein D1816_24110 [Aquimarina sp. AD10]|uniref:Uncharacterized protein n=1 Tax=Aquimarina aggregata TaxID=1642818 RepID=A0A163A9T2_9FLAO|nr:MULTISPECIES: hypothetical protein [Aquimarina]AXT63293.1 hypothetical protein D1816_24110 [Aquimarina sp. AD10]KZS40375.1 hypothetical protein AWE51_05310 [Aquimarina aggregata]RKN00694.1 hypothetical protein D7033_07585 [Aquimarina sp. AD10]
MHTIKNDCDYQSIDDVNDIYNLVKKNSNCAQLLIKHIDLLLENKHLSESIVQILTSIRNTCAIHVMNLARVAK